MNYKLMTENCQILIGKVEIMEGIKKSNYSDDVMKKSVFRLAWPIFVQCLLGMCLGYVDTIMLSNYSDSSVGSVGNANQVLGFLTLAFSIISSATGIMISQYLGAGKKKEIGKVYTVSIAFNLLLSVVISAVVFLFSMQLLTVMNVPKEMFGNANTYMQIVGGFIFTQAVFDAFDQIFRSNGKTMAGMFLAFAMNILNILGNFCFLYGPLSYLNLGVTGVAISTSISRVVVLIIAIIYFKFAIDGSISIKYLKPFPFDVLKKLLRIGIPTAGENISYNFSQIIISIAVNTMGTVAITTRIYANILCNFAYMYALSMAMATQILVGHSVGSGDYDYAYKRVLKTMKTAILISVIIATVNYFISPYTFALFTQNADIIALGSQVMFIAIFLEIGRSTNLVIINSMKASGDIKFPTMLGIVSMWGVSVLLGFLLGIVFNMGLVGVWIAMASDEILRGIVVLVRWLRGTWRGKSIIKKDDPEEMVMQE